MGEFKKGQQVIHCRDGLAVIVDETEIAGNGYFIVKTARGGGENIYVPIDRAGVIVRPLMNEKEADELVEFMKSVSVEFNSNTKQRRDSLKRKLSSGNVHDIADLFKQYYFYKTSNDGSVRFGPVDLDMLEYATNNLLDELSISYNQPRDQIEQYIFNKLS